MMSATSLASLLVSTAGVLAALIFGLLALKRPWLATGTTLVSLAVVPFWVGVNLGVFFVSAHLVLMVLASLSLLANGLSPVKPNLVDIVLVALLVLLFGAMVANLTTLHQVYTYLQWMLAYWFARLAATAFGVPRLVRVLALTFPFVAVAMIFEFATGINLWQTFFSMNNQQFTQWATLQSRGGVLRAEGPFGHSIAAGSVLAVAAILTLDAKVRQWVRLTLVAVLAAGILVTISRIAMVTLALGLCLAALLARTGLTRISRGIVVAGLAAGGAVFSFLLSDVFAESGSEAANSAAYRLWLLDLLPLLNPLGYASGYSRSTSGTTSFGSFGSVDNAVLHFALTAGWIPVLVMLGVMAAAVVALARRRGGVATAAVVAQLPALLTVALITSYSTVFWLSAGLAVSEIVRSRKPIHSPLPSESIGSPSASEGNHALGSWSPPAEVSARFSRRL